jgi:hypothetical protein
MDGARTVFPHEKNRPIDHRGDRSAADAFRTRRRSGDVSSFDFQLTQAVLSAGFTHER